MTRRKHEPMGPFAPPNPSEAEEERGLPMAVASDIASPHDAFMPTTASLDAYDERVGGVPREKMMARSHKENVAAERPSGYSKVDQHGFRHPGEEGEDEG